MSNWIYTKDTIQTVKIRGKDNVDAFITKVEKQIEATEIYGVRLPDDEVGKRRQYAAFTGWSPQADGVWSLNVGRPQSERKPEVSIYLDCQGYPGGVAQWTSDIGIDLTKEGRLVSGHKAFFG